MKTLLLTALLATSFFATQAQAAGGEIRGLTQVSNSELEVTIYSRYYCNDPIVELDYQISGKAIFGPHVYELSVIGVNRMLCPGKQEFTAIVEIPEGRRVGDVIVIQGDNKTSANVTLQ